MADIGVGCLCLRGNDFCVGFSGVCAVEGLGWGVCLSGQCVLVAWGCDVGISCVNMREREVGL